MNEYTKQDIEAAIRAITSMIDKSDNAQEKFTSGTSQHTLQKNRIKALYVILSLVKNELSENDIISYSKEDLETAVAPIASLISKSEKAREKLKQGAWQHTMLSDNLKALYIAYPLLTKALHEG